MGTTAEKLQAIITSKEAIRQAIVEKGVSCDTTVPLDEYATKIGDISGGGNTNITRYDLTLSSYTWYAYSSLGATAYRLNISNPIDIPIKNAYKIRRTDGATELAVGTYTGYSCSDSRADVISTFEIKEVNNQKYLSVSYCTQGKNLGCINSGDGYRYYIELDLDKVLELYQFTLSGDLCILAGSGVVKTTDSNAVQASISSQAINNPVNNKYLLNGSFSIKTYNGVDYLCINATASS